MNKENKPYLIISEECDEIQINIKHSKPYMDLQQENQQLKSVLDERELEIKTLVLELLRIAKQNYYWVTNDKFEEAKKKAVHFTVMGDNDKKYFVEELDKVGDK